MYLAIGEYSDTTEMTIHPKLSVVANKVFDRPEAQRTKPIEGG